jgi:hypothetical protein
MKTAFALALLFLVHSAAVAESHGVSHHESLNQCPLIRSIPPLQSETSKGILLKFDEYARLQWLRFKRHLSAIPFVR